MAARNFVVEVKEREADQPCFLIFALAEDIGLGGKTIKLDLKAGTGIEDAQTIAQALNRLVEKVSLTQP